MSDRTKAQIAFAEAVATTMWVKGLITAKEREQIVQKAGEKIQKSNC